MLNNEYKFRDSFKEFNSLDNLKRLNTNKDGEIDLKEIKKADIDNDGVISDSEFDKLGINSKVIQDELTSKLPNLKNSSINPNQIVFKVKDIDKKINDLKPKNNNDVLYPSFVTLESKKEPNHRASEDIHEKYLTVKSLLKNQSLFNKFNDAFNKINPKDENKLNFLLDETIKKIPFNLDKADLVLKSAKINIPRIVDRWNLSDLSPITSFGLLYVRLSSKNINELDRLSDINNQSFKQEGYAENLATQAKSVGVGNCSEHAAFSAIESKKLGAQKVEVFGLNIQGGHAFVVINRDKNSKDSEPNTWGDKCIVIDSWRNITYNSSDYFKFNDIKPFIDAEIK